MLILTGRNSSNAAMMRRVPLAACPPVRLGECDRLGKRWQLKARTRVRCAGRDRSAESGGR